MVLRFPKILSPVLGHLSGGGSAQAGACTSGVFIRIFASDRAGASYSCRKEQFPRAATTEGAPLCTPPGTAPHPSGSLLLASVLGVAGLGELEWAGAKATCSRLSVAFSEGFIYLWIYFARSSLAPTHWLAGR